MLSSFRDRPVRPLRHLSVIKISAAGKIANLERPKQVIIGSRIFEFLGIFAQRPFTYGTKWDPVKARIHRRCVPPALRTYHPWYAAAKCDTIPEIRPWGFMGFCGYF